MASNSPKYRDYFITINQGAECYENALEEVKNHCNFKLYAFIIHDKDILIEYDETEGTITKKPKTIHKHIVIELKNPVTFESMQKKFPGAHIEVIKYKKSAYQYLIHNSPKSKEKYQYAVEDIISNNITQVKFAIESETYELFKENMFLRYIAEGTRTPYQFTKRFGLNAYRQYWKPYCEMLMLMDKDEEMKADLEAMETALQNELPF